MQIANDNDNRTYLKLELFIGSRNNQTEHAERMAVATTIKGLDQTKQTILIVHDNHPFQDYFNTKTKANLALLIN